MNRMRRVLALWRSGGVTSVAKALLRRFVFKGWRSLVLEHKLPIRQSALTWPAGYVYQWLGCKAELSSEKSDELRMQGAGMFFESLAEIDRVYAVWFGTELASYGAVMSNSRQHSVVGLPAQACLIGMCETVPTHRRKGLFSLALMQTVQTLRDQGHDEIFVEVEESNLPSRLGITKAGFQHWARVDAQIWFGRWVRRGGRWHRMVREH